MIAESLPDTAAAATVAPALATTATARETAQQQ